MSGANDLFPDIWENAEVKEALTWEGHRMRIFRKGSYFFLKRRCYFLTSVFWAICNGARAFYIKLKR